MALKNNLENLKRTNKLLMGLNFCSVAVIGLLVYGVIHLSDVRRLYLPPAFEAGVVLRGNEVPEPTVYTFALTMWQQLNRWNEDGEKDYPNNIRRLRDFVTPTFKERLRQDVRARINGSNGAVNELRGRERTVELPADFVYDSGNVRKLDDGSWVVNLVLDLKETYEGLEVKAVRIKYPLVIKRFEVDWKRNPWGLAIAGYAENGPERITDKTVSMVDRQ